jgi:uncharacterized protein (TIGR03437 family)
MLAILVSNAAFAATTTWQEVVLPAGATNIGVLNGQVMTIRKDGKWQVWSGGKLVAAAEMDVSAVVRDSRLPGWEHRNVLYSKGGEVRWSEVYVGQNQTPNGLVPFKLWSLKSSSGEIFQFGDSLHNFDGFLDGVGEIYGVLPGQDGKLYAYVKTQWAPGSPIPQSLYKAKVGIFRLDPVTNVPGVKFTFRKVVDTLELREFSPLPDGSFLLVTKDGKLVVLKGTTQTVLGTDKAATISLDAETGNATASAEGIGRLWTAGGMKEFSFPDKRTFQVRSVRGEKVLLSTTREVFVWEKGVFSPVFSDGDSLIARFVGKVDMSITLSPTDTVLVAQASPAALVEGKVVVEQPKPKPEVRAVINAANEVTAPATLAPGTLGTIFGPENSTQPIFGSLGDAGSQVLYTLGGAEVSVCGKQVRMMFNSGGSGLNRPQINFHVPDSVSVGECDLVVTVNSVRSDAFKVRIERSTPALFTFKPNSADPAIPNPGVTLPVITKLIALEGQYFQVVVGPTSLPGVNYLHPIRSQDALTFWGTGCGTTSPALPDGVNTPTDRLHHCENQPSISLDGVPLSVLFAGRAPGFYGLDQYDVQLPTLEAGKHLLKVGEMQYDLYVE